MPIAISMPRLGMTMEEGIVIEWSHSVGTSVEKGEIILIIESEKSEVEIESPGSGVFRHIYIEEGETVPCGTLLGAITETADEAFDAEAFAHENSDSEEKDSGGLKVRAVPAADEQAVEKGPAIRTEKKVVPAARAAARKLGIDPQDVTGTGPHGRVTKQDVEAYAAAREALVSVASGVSLEVAKAGEGETVVLLPGLGSDISSFARQTALLTEKFHVHGINPRGVSLSDAPEAEVYSVDQTAADAAEVYEGAAHVIGASLGAAAALELALTQPERVKTLTLITPFVEATPRLLAVGSAWKELAEEASSETLALALMPWLFSSEFLSDAAARSRTQRGLAQMVARVPAKTLERMTAGLEAWSGSRIADLSGLSVPTLVIVAGEDLLTPDADRLAQSIPGARLLRVETAGHAVALEEPEAVNEAILAHLA
ncbi:MAG: alpha/beta fold hydrolase [Myxococcota bacterium]|nr:alpha/beta fold hydrolase [Myxococcota bacterium]